MRIITIKVTVWLRWTAFDMLDFCIQVYIKPKAFTQLNIQKVKHYFQFLDTCTFLKLFSTSSLLYLMYVDLQQPHGDTVIVKKDPKTDKYKWNCDYYFHSESPQWSAVQWAPPAGWTEHYTQQGGVIIYIWYVLLLLADCWGLFRLHLGPSDTSSISFCF